MLIISLLNDQELAYLGASWEEYRETADRYGIRILRYPVVEGAGPVDIQNFDDEVIRFIDESVQKGENVLCHCRGGELQHSRSFHFQAQTSYQRSKRLLIIRRRSGGPGGLLLVTETRIMLNG